MLIRGLQVSIGIQRDLIDGHRAMIPRLFVSIIVLAGVAGWVFAFDAMQGRDALERRATQAELSLSAKSKEAKELAALVESYKRGEKAANLKEVMKQLQTSRKELASVTTKIAPVKKELRELTTKINAAGDELDKLRASAKQFEALFSGARQKYRTTTRARVRAGPGTDFNEVAILPSGITLPSFETVEDGNWQKVGYIGYVHNDLLEPISDE